MCFEHREAVADTNPLAAAERIVGEGMTPLLALGQKAIRIEAFRFVPEVWMPVRGVWKNQQEGSGGHEHPAEVVVDGRVARLGLQASSGMLHAFASRTRTSG
jgi:hypothetical protein